MVDKRAGVGVSDETPCALGDRQGGEEFERSSGDWGEGAAPRRHRLRWCLGASLQEGDGRRRWVGGRWRLWSRPWQGRQRLGEQSSAQPCAHGGSTHGRGGGGYRK
jgi:hypothetical protein